MKFKRLFNLSCLAVGTMASMAANADIKNNYGHHYLKLINNTSGQSMYVFTLLGDTEKAGQHQCVRIRPGQTVNVRSYTIMSGDRLKYAAYSGTNCQYNGHTVTRWNINKIHSDANEYWYVWF